MKTFYDHQEQARENSTIFMAILGLAIGLTTLATGLMVTLWIFSPLYWFYLKAFPRPETNFTIHMHPDQYHPIQMWLVEHFPWMMEFPWELFGFFYTVVTLAVGTAILVTTKNKLRELWKAGGVGVANCLGGVCVTKEGYRRDDRTQRAVNVVNEIAIASRIPEPHVYVLHNEPGVNAFAIGLTPADTVIGMTAGAVSGLNREQLQAVVAHEFAHVKNGDTRTNVLLVGYLHGLMCVIISAQSLINQGIDMAVKSISHGGQGVVGISTAAMGVLLWPVGLIGLCFATIVKAAYSRQREYLADASAIEFTRNDIGLLMAMKRILGTKHGSRVRSPSCLAINHVFFAQSCGGVLGLVDSHPPLEKRIKRIDPHWDGEVEFEEEHDVGSFDGVLDGTMSIAQQARSNESGRLMPTGGGAATDFKELEINTDVVMGVNQHAVAIRAMVAPQLWALTQSLPTAEAMVFALWAVGQRETTDDDVELNSLGKTCDAAKQVADALKPHVESYGLPERLMLFDASINMIRQEAQKGDLKEFCEKAETLLAEEMDDDLFRWAWRKTVRELVNRELEVTRPSPKFREVEEVLEDCQVLLSALAYANDNDVMEGYSLMRAANVLEHDIELLPREACGLEQVDSSLEHLQLLAPKARRQLVLAGSASIDTDEMMNEAEALLMRGICSGLGYPPATLLPGQPVRK